MRGQSELEPYNEGQDKESGIMARTADLGAGEPCSSLGIGSTSCTSTPKRAPSQRCSADEKENLGLGKLIRANAHGTIGNSVQQPIKM